MEPGLARDALTLLLGFTTGVLSALFGIGGAIVSNPGLRALGAAPLVAVGTTLPSILPGAISGTLRYRREGLIDWQLIIPAAASGLLAVVAGSLLSHAVPGGGHLLLLLIAVLLAFTAWRTAVGPPAPTPRPRGAAEDVADRSAPEDRRTRWRAAGIGVVAGLLSGLLGIGGGVIMVPAFTELLGMSLKSAIATSLVCVGIFGVPATITHAFLGDIDWRLAVLLTIGVIPGLGSGRRSPSAPPSAACAWPSASSWPWSPSSTSSPRPGPCSPSEPSSPERSSATASEEAQVALLGPAGQAELAAAEQEDDAEQQDADADAGGQGGRVDAGADGGREGDQDQPDQHDPAADAQGAGEGAVLEAALGQAGQLDRRRRVGRVGHRLAGPHGQRHPPPRLRSTGPSPGPLRAGPPGSLIPSGGRPPRTW